MIDISYRKTIPYRFDVVLSQYFDYEHIEHVHPESLGKYVVLRQDGNVIEYEQVWPRGKKKSLIRHTFRPPGAMTFEFIGGRHKGTVVETSLVDLEDLTEIHETYRIPWIPNWNWLKPLIRPGVLEVVNHVWQEDLDVDVCYNGWPGIPGQPVIVPTTGNLPEHEGWEDVARLDELEGKVLQCQTIRDASLLVVRMQDHWHVLENHCPHTGGPLAKGRLDGDSVICPWHGARFRVRDGECQSGPAPRALRCFPTRIVDDTLQVWFEDGG